MVIFSIRVILGYFLIQFDHKLLDKKDALLHFSYPKTFANCGELGSIIKQPVGGLCKLLSRCLIVSFVILFKQAFSAMLRIFWTSLWCSNIISWHLLTFILFISFCILRYNNNFWGMSKTPQKSSSVCLWKLDTLTFSWVFTVWQITYSFAANYFSK